MARGVVLYSLDISHYCVAAERMLAYKGIRYVRRYAPYHDRQALLRATGQDYVPALVWDGTFVPWTDVARFLDARQPAPPLLPPDLAPVAEALENWAHQVVEERVWRAVVTEILPALKSDRERWVFEELQTRARGPWEVLRRRRPEFRREVATHLELIDRMLSGRDWILGRPTVADFGLYGSLSPWITAGRRWPPRLRALSAWYERIGQL